MKSSETGERPARLEKVSEGGREIQDDVIEMGRNQMTSGLVSQG